MSAQAPWLSIVVPLYNEVECVERLVGQVSDALASGPTWELLLVDDGSTDGTGEEAEKLAARDARVQVVRMLRNRGQSRAMQEGFDRARGRVVASMDGDLQNDPRDIPRLLSKLDEGYELVAGYRMNRRDRLLTRKVPSWVANRIIQRLTGVPIRDNGCSLKAYRAELLDRLRLYSDMHRFIPALAAAAGGARIAEIPVRHHPRRYGESKYGLSRIAQVLADLLVIKMIRSFRDRPLLLFGSGAGMVGGLGLLLGIGAGLRILWWGPMAAEPLVIPGAILLSLGLGGYLFMLGLIAEVAVLEHRRRRGMARPVVHVEAG